jgi:hypothetical protein
MNGTGIKGGAFGFRVSSINKVYRFSQKVSGAEVFLIARRHQVREQHDPPAFS